MSRFIIWKNAGNKGLAFIQKNAQALNLDAFELLEDPIAAPFDKLRDLRLQDDD